MIPKIIHYCWFGGKPLPEDVRSYIDTWKKHLPDFEIKQWDETNFDIDSFKYTRQAYFARKYAFVSDVARLYALVEEGGLYLDTDILIKKTFPDQWFNADGFGSFEHDSYVETGLLASSRGNKLISDFLENYHHISFFKGLRFDQTPNVIRFTRYMEMLGFEMNNKQQTRCGFTIFPQQLLCGKDWQRGRYDDDTTFAVHDYVGSWGTPGVSPLKMYLNNARTVINWHLKKL